MALTTSGWCLAPNVAQAQQVDPGEPAVVSSSADGVEANRMTQSDIGVSRNGRYVAFSTRATNLVEDDINGKQDVFVKDTATGAVTLASTARSGRPANGPSVFADLTTDGRYALFVSRATNLVDRPVRGWKLYRADLATGEVVLASTDAHGRVDRRGVHGGQVSDSGRYVTYTSYDTRIAGRRLPSGGQVVRKDLRTGRVVLVSASSAGRPAQPDAVGANSYSFDISANGRYVTFVSWASNLVSRDRNGGRDVFRKDLRTWDLELVSATKAGRQTPYSSRGYGPQGGNMSANGRYIVFVSDWGAPDGMRQEGVFRKDMQSGKLRRVSVDGRGRVLRGNPVSVDISDDGATAVMVFGRGNCWGCSYAKDMSTGDLAALGRRAERRGRLQAQELRISAGGSQVVFVGGRDYQVWLQPLEADS